MRDSSRSGGKTGSSGRNENRTGTGCRGLEVRPDGVLCETEDNQQIRKEDKRRADNYRYYTGRIWGMSVSFDLALNTELGMGYIEECIQKAL